MKKERIIFIDITRRKFKNRIAKIIEEMSSDFFSRHEDVSLKELLKTPQPFTKLLSDVYHNKLDNIKDPIKLYKLIEKFYDYWRDCKRYIIADLGNAKKVTEDNFLIAFENANNYFLRIYRHICTNLTGRSFSVYRELPAGANAFILLDKVNMEINPKVDNIKLIKKVAFKTPFVTYSANNTRKGVFPIINENPLKKLKIDETKWFLYPILVGNSHIYVYCNERYISLALSLSNLFEHDLSFERPDGIILFGANTEDGIYYDKANDLYIGSLQERDEIDYFGYLKKIILTVHNIKMINNHFLPIHGAGVSIKLKNGKTKNVVLIGDSGAGKSEVLEELRRVASDYINDIQTIYDDMGTMEIKNKKVVTYGTEIGAFVRTDDLANDYVYKVFDRAIFLNPNAKNSRLVLPVSDYDSIIKKYKVDYVLYANNYEVNEENIRLFNNKDEALEVFKKGARVALGTTNEKGLVSTFFANPFGPVQLQEETSKLLDEYFTMLFTNKICVGELYTGLSLDDKQEHILAATKSLLKLLKKD